MHAIRLHAFGPAHNLTYEKTEDPEPGPGHVRIAVAAGACTCWTPRSAQV